MTQPMLPWFCLCGQPLPSDTSAAPESTSPTLEHAGYQCECGRFWIEADGEWELSRDLEPMTWMNMEARR